MTIYQDVFGGANIYPSEISYSAIALNVDVILSWPEETSANENLATRIIDVTPAGAGFSIFLPAANKTGVGNTMGQALVKVILNTSGVLKILDGATERNPTLAIFGTATDIADMTYASLSILKI